jgi:ketosteroid isomerase-like protein
MLEWNRAAASTPTLCRFLYSQNLEVIMSFFTKSFALLIISFFCVLQSPAQDKADAKVQKQEKLKQELMQLQRTINEAETKRDFAALDRMLTEDYIFTESTGRVSDRKQLYEDSKKSEPPTGETISYDDVKLFPYRNSAVMSYLLIVNVRDKDGKENIYRFRGTVTWVRQQKRWRMAAIHVAHVRN